MASQGMQVLLTLLRMRPPIFTTSHCMSSLSTFSACSVLGSVSGSAHVLRLSEARSARTQQLAYYTSTLLLARHSLYLPDGGYLTSTRESSILLQRHKRPHCVKCARRVGMMQSSPT